MLMKINSAIQVGELTYIACRSYKSTAGISGLYFPYICREHTNFMKQLLFTLALLLAISACTANSSSASAGKDSTVADNSASPYFPPVMQQGVVGSCDWFAVAYYQMTYMRNRMLDKSYDPKETFSPKFGFTLINNGKDFPWNMWFIDVYELLKKHGNPFLPDCPYDAATGTHYREWPVDSAIWRRALYNRIEGYESLDFDLDKVRKLVREGEVLVIQFNPARVNYMQAKDNPVTRLDDAAIGDHVLSAGVEGPDHTVCMVGYNDHIWIDRNGNAKPEQDELGAFKIAESMSDGFVNDGYRWMSYAALADTTAGILFQRKLWRVFLRDSYQPKVIAQVCVEHAERGKLKMQLGRSRQATSASALESSRVFDPYALGFSAGASGKSLIEGADFSFNGEEGMHEGCFTFDLTDLQSATEEPETFWFLRLNNLSEQGGRVTVFRIVDMRNGSVKECKTLPAKLIQGGNVLFTAPERESGKLP
jgi:hypothetical protein